MWKLEAGILVWLTASLLVNHHFLHPMFAYFGWHFHRQTRILDTDRLVRQLLMGEGFFMLVYCLWVEVNGECLIDYMPVLLYAIIILTDIRESFEIRSAVEKNKHLKDNYIFLLNNCQLYVLAYHIAELFLTGGRTISTTILFFLMRFKYGFNAPLQKLFSNTHQSIVALLSGCGPLLKVYMLFYRAMGYVGKIYIQNGRRVQPGNTSLRKTE